MTQVKVKPLVWDGVEDDCYVTSETPIGTYELIVTDTLEMCHHYAWGVSVELCNPRRRISLSRPNASSFLEAKAAAQADYEQRILAALEL